MTRATGQVLRRVGLLTEVACLFGLTTAGRRGAAAGGGPFRPDLLFAVGIGLGLTAWVVGTAAIYWPGRKAPDRD